MKAIQNATRVCSDYTYWATGGYYQYSRVANVSDNKLVTVAGCGGEDVRCPSPENALEGLDKNETGWDFHVDNQDSSYNPDVTGAPVMRIDPDFRYQDVLKMHA